MGGIGGPELFIVVLVTLLVFGPKKIPEIARGIGKGLREFRKLSTELQREMNLSEVDDEVPRTESIRPPRTPGTEPRGGDPAPESQNQLKSPDDSHDP